MDMPKIQGLEKVIYTELPPQGTILVEGDTGVLKTTFVMECIKADLDADENKTCLYISLKEDHELLAEKAGLKKYIEQGRFHIVDYDTLFEKVQPHLIKKNIFDGISNLVSEFNGKFKQGISIFAIDPINVLESVINMRDIRRLLFHFFSALNEMGIRNWIVMESFWNQEDIGASLPYHFLADGIMTLGMMETVDDVVRYLQVVKLRGANHSLKRFQVSYKSEGFKVLGAVYES